MVRDADATAKNAEASTSNAAGMCLQWSRERAAIAALQPDAATAWKHAHNRHPGDRNPPRGAMVYWTGGSHGYGHIAVSLGGGKIRSSDANGSGRPATVDLGWVERAWGMPYAGWADNVNDVVIPGVGGGSSNNGGDDDMPKYDHAARKAATKIKANEWTAIEWDSVAGSNSLFTVGDVSAALGGRTYTSSLKVTFDAPNGATIRLQNVEAKSGTIEETNPQTEVIANGGNTYGSHEQIGSVKSDRRLRFRVTCTENATLLNADVTVLSW